MSSEVAVIQPHPSAKYAVTGDRTIVAVHCFTLGYLGSLTNENTIVLVSAAMQSANGAHVWGVPQWRNADTMIAYCQTFDAARQYLTYIRQQDRQADA